MEEKRSESSAYLYNTSTPDSSFIESKSWLVNPNTNELSVVCQSSSSLDDGRLTTFTYTAHLDRHSQKDQYLQKEKLPLLEDRLRVIIPYADRDIIAAYAKDEPRVKLIDCKLPDGVSLVETSDADCKYLVADRDFEEGELVYTNDFHLETDFSSIFIMDINGQLLQLDHANHFVYRTGYMEVVGFDIFLDHSCYPNTRQEYVSLNKYHTYATRAIERGDKITCNFMSNSNSNSTPVVAEMTTGLYLCMCGDEGCRSQSEHGSES